MEYEYQITQAEQRILDALNNNIRILENLTHQKLFSVFSGRFLDTYQLERNIELKEKDAVGYVIGLTDANVLDDAEADEWIYQIDRATITSVAPSDEAELDAKSFFEEYNGWKSEVEEWLKHCFGNKAEEEVADESEID